MTVNFGILSDARPVQSQSLLVCRSVVALDKAVSPAKEEVFVLPSCILAKTHGCMILSCKIWQILHHNLQRLSLQVGEG